MRHKIIQSLVLVAILAVAAIPATGQSIDPPRVTILDVGRASQSLRISLATAGLDGRDAVPSTLRVSAWLDACPSTPRCR